MLLERFQNAGGVVALLCLGSLMWRRDEVRAASVSTGGILIR